MQQAWPRGSIRRRFRKMAAGQAMQDDIVLLCAAFLELLGQLPPPFVPEGAIGKIAVLCNKYEAGVVSYLDPPDVAMGEDPIVDLLAAKATE